MKKVLIAKLNLEQTYSGATRTVYEQIKYFKNLGYEVHVVGELINKVDIIAAGAKPHKTIRWPWQKKFKRRLQFSNQSEKLVKRICPSITIGHGDLQHQDIFLLHNSVHLAEEKINGKALSSGNEMHQTHTPILKNQQFKYMIANSQMMKDDLIHRFQIDKDKISVIYPAIDTQQFQIMNKEEIEDIRSELGIKEGEFFVGLVTSGNFKKRGVDRFFAAINLLPKEIALKTHFIFVGKDKLSSEVQALLDKSPYKERIRLLPIIYNVQKYFNALDVFVLPARVEEFGRVVAEAMSCGCPVITTSWVGAAELMEGKSRDFIYNGEDIQELATLITSLLEDEHIRAEVRELNALAAKKVTEKEMFHRLDDILNYI